MDVWLLGNGFDLAHKLPTKYENFLHTMEFLINHKEEKFKTVGEIFGNEELKSNDPFIEESYNAYREIYAKRQPFIRKDMIEKAKENCWLQYFISCFNRDLGWIDFEKEIANVVNTFKILLENDKSNFNLGSFDSEQCQIINNFDFFYIMHGGFGDNNVTIKDEFLISKPYGSSNIIKNKEKIVNKLFDYLIEFSELLIMYLKIFIDDSLESMADYALFTEIKNLNCKIISFNYTQTIEKIYFNSGCHIHGPNKNNDIVLGINSDKDDKIETVDTLFLNFKKYYQRVRYNTDIEYLNVIDAIKKQKSDEEKVFLTVVGHSLDVTDEDIIREVFDLADVITIYYHNENKVGDYIKNLVKLYGRKGFDELRRVKKLKFKSTRMNS